MSEIKIKTCKRSIVLKLGKRWRGKIRINRETGTIIISQNTQYKLERDTSRDLQVTYCDEKVVYCDEKVTFEPCKENKKSKVKFLERLSVFDRLNMPLESPKERDEIDDSKRACSDIPGWNRWTDEEKKAYLDEELDEYKRHDVSVNFPETVPMSSLSLALTELKKLKERMDRFEPKSILSLCEKDI